jgi:ATP-dependent exoDNAse (exonuclease V) beta subunit
MDEVEREREKQETRRLLYVALTRARDRLYLSTALKDGAFAPGPGSLGEVLPESIRTLFVRAATAFDELPTLAWTGTSGRTFELLRLSSRTPAEAAPRADVEGRRYLRSGRVSCPPASSQEVRHDTRLDPHPALVGRLVHRLFAAAQPDSTDALAEEALARRLLLPEERVESADAEAVVADAVRAWRGLRDRDDVRGLLSGGTCLHEVPFSLRSAGTSTIVRGVIDCLVQRADGSVAVVEFKTGARRPEHEQQLAIYLTAARALFPASAVDGVLIYA